MEQVNETELERLVQLRPLVHDCERLRRDLSAQEAAEAEERFRAEGMGAFLGALAWPGVATRWRHFLAWLCDKRAHSAMPADVREAFFGFGASLGRVRSFRALALSDEQLAQIHAADSIWPSGRLRASAAQVAEVVEAKGVSHVAVGRLYIGLGMLPIDPSLSLHDDWETAVCIASTYLREREKPVYLFELDVPLVEVLGWSVLDVQERAGRGSERWFKHNHVWFDSHDPRTERYALYELPFLSQRCISMRRFQSRAAIKAAISRFQQQQLGKMLNEEFAKR